MKRIYYVVFKDYDEWFSYDEWFETRKAAVKYANEMHEKYPFTAHHVVTKKQAQKIGAI